MTTDEPSWVKVTERMPEPRLWCCVVVGGQRSVGWWHEDGEWYLRWWPNGDCVVTHWQKFPTLPDDAPDDARVSAVRNVDAFVEAARRAVNARMR